MQIPFSTTFGTLPFFAGSVKNHKRAIDDMDKVLKQPLEKLGLRRIGGINNARYETEISFSPDAVLKGLENDDWEQALDPIKQKWQQINRSVDWTRLLQIINQKVS